MPTTSSKLQRFIVDALMIKKYPNLKWFDQENLKVVLECPNKRNKYWSEEYAKIYGDWHNIKEDRTGAENDKRERLITALKRSPYFKLCKKDSEKGKNVYQIIKQVEVVRAALSSHVAEAVSMNQLTENNFTERVKSESAGAEGTTSALSGNVAESLSTCPEVTESSFGGRMESESACTGAEVATSALSGNVAESLATYPEPTESAFGGRMESESASNKK